MKKRKILVLFPFLGLLLSGCTFQEALDNVKDWTNGHILDPIKNLINGGEKEEQSGGDEEGGDKPAEVTIKRIRVESCPTEVAVNYVYKTSEVSIKVFYSDGTEEVVEPETVRCDTSTPGDSTLYVTYKGFESDYPVKVLSEEEVVHVETITVESRYVNDMHVGDTYTIQVTVLPSDATNKAVTFASENEELATVSADGVVTAVGAGVVKVNIASVDTPSVTNWVQFTIAEVAAGLPGATKAGYTKLAASETLLSGEKVNFAGAIGEKYYAMPNYTEGNNIKVKEVSTEDGKLVIEDIVEDTKTFTHEFTVIDNGDETYSFMQADGKYLSAAGANSSNWLKVVSSINETAKFKVSVDENGYTQLVAPAVARGSLCLNPNSGNPIFACYAESKFEPYALYHDGKGSTAHVDVESIAFEKSAYSMEEGDSLQLSVNVLPALASDKQYSLEIKSADPEGCVTLSGNTVTAVSQGTAVILAKSHENAEITATTTITVTEHIERNYGSLENPLSIAEAKAVIDLDGGTAKETIYIKGKVSKNDAYNSNYHNTNVWLSDGVNDFELYGALMPEGFEPAQPAKDDAALVGKIVVAHGSGKIYGTTYEFDKNCQIDSVEDDIVTITGLIPDSATGIPATIEQGESLDRTDINIGVTFSDGSEGVSHPDSIELSTETLGQTQGKLILGEFEYPFTIEVVEKVVKNYGTLENPLTVSQALALITEECPNPDDVTKEQIYCEGTVSVKGTEKSYGYQNVKVSDGQSEVLIYSLNMTTEQKAQFDVGTVIEFHGYAKNFKGTLEFATNGSDYVTVDVVTVPEVAVTGISLNENELNMAVGMPDATLVATIAPENASNKGVEWSSSNQEVATVDENGVVHAVGAGDAVITAKSAADNTITATCDVHVTVPQKQLIGIEVTTMPIVEYTEGDLLDLSGMVVTLHYDDQSSAEITSGWTTNIAADHELTLQDTSLVVSYGGFDATAITLTITAKPQPTHAGSAEDPYTGEDAVIVANNLAAGEVTEDSYYIKGVVESFEESFNPTYGNYSFKIEGGFIGWRLKNGSGGAKFNEGDLEVGDTVTMYVQIQAYIKNAGDTPKPESKGGYIVSIEKPVVAPETVEITSGSELAVGSSMNLAATVGPQGAAQDVEWSIVSGGEYATLADGVLTGVAAGDVTVRATATGYANVYAEKTITVSSTVVPTQEHEVSWTATAANNLGSQISSAGGTATGHISTGDFSWDYTRTLVSLASGKSDNISWQGSTWIQLGSNNAQESLVLETSAIPGTIKSVSVVAASAGGQHTLTIDVNGTKYLNAVDLASYSGTAGATNPDPADAACINTGTGSASGKITISILPKGTTKKAFVIRSITVVYEQ